MTNHWIDIGNSDCILIMGSNAAENHPISFKWVTKAVENGATLISVDPRFTRTSAKADIYAPIRSGTDIAFLGGMIKFILDNDLIHRDYVVHYTNASFMVSPDFKGPGELDGLFSGYDEEKRAYDTSTWAFQKNTDGTPKKDPLLKDTNCVYQLLKKHFSRYAPDLVSSITGTPKEKLLAIYKVYTATGAPGKAGTVMYAMGWTQHTVGVQNIRAMAIIQLLLGNIGMSGGGVNALRGESNVQGSTDHCLLWHILPGYLKIPKSTDTNLEAHIKRAAPTTQDPKSANWWGNYSKYIVSYLTSLYGSYAHKGNDFCFPYLPKVDEGKNYSWITLFDDMYRGRFKGFFAWGQNPVCSGPNGEMTAQALAKLDWMVNVNLWETETGAFWKRPGADPSKIKTEVFLLPCAASMEKAGSITNSGRWSQWRYKAVDPPGQARPDAEIIHEIFVRLKALYEKEGGPLPEAITKLTWDYGRPGHVDAHLIAKEINGYFLKDTIFPKKNTSFSKGDLVPSFAYLKDDGSTSSGNWLYCASYTNAGNMAARRDLSDPSGIGLYSKWSWCWPVNRRILYNRASVDLKGLPFDKKRPVIRFAGAEENGKYTSNKWIGDVPDGGWYPLQNPDGSWRADAKYAFIMKPEGQAQIFGPGRRDGPFPEHYEPLECPVENILSGTQYNPTIYRWDLKGAGKDVYAEVCDPRFPIVCTTYRVSEHWQTGAMTRNTPWLAELQPDMFVEMSKELAELKGIENGEWVTVESARNKIRAVAMVTDRFRPFKVGGAIVHQVGMPWCFGYMGYVTGDSANLLTPNIGDANTMIPESKAFLVNVRKGA